MTTATRPAHSPSPISLPIHRLSVEQYHRMIEENILHETDNLELIEGYLVPKMTRKPPHDIALELTDDALRPLVPTGWRLRCQSAVTTADSEPEPDFVIVRGPPRARRGRHPQPGEIAVIVEVADSSLDYDRVHKARLYARAGVPVYWILNLQDGQIEVYENPQSPPDSDPAYATRTVYRAGQSAALVIDTAAVGSVAVDAVLP